jgi:O-antigen/teichoic acid export membrane protein
MPKSVPARKPARPRGEQFVINVLWSWTGVAAKLFVGFIITPFIIRRLGAEQYGIWGLIFSILDYFWFFDLGLNTAVCNFCARFIAVQNHEKINEVISTSLFYFSLIALTVWTIAPFAARNAYRFFYVSVAYRPEFANLILITTISWGVCIVLHMFVSALDGFQRFDLTSRVWVAMLALRSVGYFLVLLSGHGLVGMAAIFVGSQILGYMLNFLNFRRVFPQLRISSSYVRVAMFRDIFRYGVKSFTANSSTLVLNQSGPVMIGHFLLEASVGFYVLPSRLLQNAVDAVSRIGIVTRSSAAELGATGRREDALKLGIYSNRYSLALFMPLVVFLRVYGRALILRWVGPQMAEHSAPLLPVFLVSNALVLAAQRNSSSLIVRVRRAWRIRLRDGHRSASLCRSVGVGDTALRHSGSSLRFHGANDCRARCLYSLAGFPRAEFLLPAIHAWNLCAAPSGGRAGMDSGLVSPKERSSRNYLAATEPGVPHLRCGILRSGVLRVPGAESPNDDSVAITRGGSTTGQP